VIAFLLLLALTQESCHLFRLNSHLTIQNRNGFKASNSQWNEFQIVC